MTTMSIELITLNAVLLHLSNRPNLTIENEVKKMTTTTTAAAIAKTTNPRWKNIYYPLTEQPAYVHSSLAFVVPLVSLSIFPLRFFLFVSVQVSVCVCE